MGAETGIAWTDSTWSPMRGCSRVSPGCEHCYAEQIAGRFSGPGKPFHGFAEKKTSTGWHTRWTRKVSLIGDQLDTPLRWRKPRRIFVNSMSDTFHEALDFDDIAAVFGVMGAAQHHTFQVLTKRAERMVAFFAWLGQNAHEKCAAALCTRDFETDSPKGRRNRLENMGAGWPWPLPNVWIGVSVEDQQRADERIPHLLRVPAAVRFLSVEPQLGPVDLTMALEDFQPLNPDLTRKPAPISWVIQGGESGPKARPFDLAWARSLRDQCRAAGVAYFLKQLGARPTVSPVGGSLTPAAIRDAVALRGFRDSHGADESEWPTDLRGCRAFPEVSHGG